VGVVASVATVAVAGGVWWMTSAAQAAVIHSAAKGDFEKYPPKRLYHKISLTEGGTPRRYHGSDDDCP
jgi:hypothetical protein